MSSPQYRHTQRIPVLLFVGLTAVVLVTVDATLAQTWPASARFAVFVNFLFAGVLLGAWFLSSMTVELSDKELRWRIGPGPVLRLARDEIDAVRQVRDPWWGGYGTTLFGVGFFPPRRWTFRIAGRDAVEVRLKQGGWRRIGTDDPQGLIAALGG